MKTTNPRPFWKATDIKDSIHLRSIEFMDNKGEWHHFELLATLPFTAEHPNRLVFGGVCNTGFLESGYLEGLECENLEDMLNELQEELETYYNDGYRYTTRIVCNDRM